jgi:hypothetical protein
MVRELIAAVIAIERNLDDQIMKLRSYQKQNDDITRQITQALDGSSHSSSQTMKGQLSTTQAQIRETLGLLETAKTKLQRVRQV